MKPEPAFFAPTSVADAIRLMDEYIGNAKIIAGGQSLMILLSEGLAQPDALIALHAIADLDRLDVDEGWLNIGANVTHQTVHASPLVRTCWPLLAEVTGSVATVQVRNRGTVCGSVAHGFPLSDPPAALLALDADACIAGSAGVRCVPLHEFFLGFLTTQLGPDEILTHLRIPPLAEHTGTAYETLRVRPLDFPVAGVAASVSLGEDGYCTRARIGLTGGGPAPMLAPAATLLEGQLPSAEVLAGVANQTAKDAEPTADLDGSEAYKRRVLKVLTRRALERAFAQVRTTR
ncbi:MAG: xanthine dehydrogenase family protein subunit M [Chloroflexota bacterium]